jgi:hypothetical protein
MTDEEHNVAMAMQEQHKQASIERANVQRAGWIAELCAMEIDEEIDGMIQKLQENMV